MRSAQTSSLRKDGFDNALVEESRCHLRRRLARVAVAALRKHPSTDSMRVRLWRREWSVNETRTQTAAAPLFSPAFIQDPYPTYREHLAGSPVQPLAAMPGRWGVFHYEACSELGRDARLSSARRVPNFFPVGEDERLELDDLFKHLGRWILMKDAPEHGRLRKSLNSGFAPAVIEKLKPRVVGVVDELLRDLECVREADLIRDLAYPLPVRVISRLLGVPDSLRAECVALSNEFATWFGNPMRTMAAARTAQAAVRRLVALFETIVRERMGKSEGDLLDLMLEIARQAQLTPEELHAQCVLLLIAGHETTRNLIGNGIYTLLRHPEVLAEVRASESAVRAAVEEVLRYESPVQAYGRGTTEDIEYGGVRIPAGSAVFFIIAAAHRDPRHVSDPDRFDIHRKHNRHLAFGTDAHVCLGSTLARLEGQIAISETLKRFPALRLIDSDADWSPIYALRGLRRMRVRL
jgi:cytochrome P450